MARTKIIINDLEALQILLQEQYERATKQCKEAQDELGILKSAQPLKDMTPEEAAKISKAKKDYMDIKLKATAMINDVAKLMADVVKHQGNVKEALDDAAGKQPAKNEGLDIRELQRQLRDATGEAKETYNVR